MSEMEWQRYFLFNNKLLWRLNEMEHKKNDQSTVFATFFKNKYYIFMRSVIIDILLLLLVLNPFVKT